MFSYIYIELLKLLRGTKEVLMGDAKSDDVSKQLVSACIQHYTSVTAGRNM